MAAVMHLGKAGVIGRFKPLHKGGALMLETICAQADRVVIGIGSSNKYNARNPFTAQESEAMVHAFLSPRFNNYDIIHIPDFSHIPECRDGRAWKEYVISHFGPLDSFVTGNPYVADLLKETYTIVHPGALIKKEKQFVLRATQVRMQMAMGADWKSFVPPEVAAFIESQNLVERFRKEFGLETIAMHAGTDYASPEDSRVEREHTYEE